MVTVKNLAFFDKNKLKNLNSFVESELDLSVFQAFPIDFIHNLLPLKLKFLDESFVALEHKKIKGLITINKTGDKRIKIKRLLLDENSYEVGKMLVNCIVPLYIGKGASSFFVVVDKMDLPIITMFKDGCGFKDYAKEVVYKAENSKEFSSREEINFDYIRKMKKGDLQSIKTLTNELITGYKRPFFSKSISELKKTILKAKEKYVISCNNNILGYFTIIKLNNSDYLLDFAIKQGFEGYAVDIINFARNNLIKKAEFKNLFFKLKNYHSNFNELTEIFNIEYKAVKENEILVKDFYIAQKQEFKYERMIFNDVTPAF